MLKTFIMSKNLCCSLLISALSLGASVSLAGVIDPNNVWPTYRKGIQTCYENYTAISEADREFVRLSIGKEFVKTPITFYGWQPCKASEVTNFIRIQISDERPHYNWRNDNGNFSGKLVLNVEYKKWSPFCSSNETERKKCLLFDALHEMGHAAGLGHEMNHPDSTCMEGRDTSDPDHNVPFGEYRPDSIMNYCARDIAGYVARLTDQDIDGIHEVYKTSYCEGGWDIRIKNDPVKYYVILQSTNSALEGTVQVPRVQGPFTLYGTCERNDDGKAVAEWFSDVPTPKGGFYQKFAGDLKDYTKIEGKVTTIDGEVLDFTAIKAD